MNAYQAIMKAAGHIEAHPREFKFSEPRVPTDCGTPGCALGWVGFFASSKKTSYDSACRDVLKVDYQTFYDRLAETEGVEIINKCSWCHGGWSRSAKACSKALRLYAEKYHGHEKPVSFAREQYEAARAAIAAPEYACG